MEDGFEGRQRIESLQGLGRPGWTRLSGPVVFCWVWLVLAAGGSAAAASFELLQLGRLEQLETVEFGGRPYLALSGIARVLGLTPELELSAGTVLVRGPAGVARLSPGSPRVWLDSVLVPLSAEPRFERGELYVPPDFLSRVAAPLLGRKIELKAGGASVLVAAAGLPVASAEPLVPRPVLTIVMDPGHGGKDKGATGKTGLEEKEIALEICRLVRQRLVQEPSIRVVLTRADDVFVDLSARTAIANERGDCFVSVHLNAGTREGANGFEVYSMSPRASDREALAASRFENQHVSSEPLPEDLEPILWDMAQNDYLNESTFFAELMVSSLSLRLAEPNRGAKQAPFLVLAGATIPAILVEVAFITNEGQEAALKTVEYRTQIAEALAGGILAYLEHHRGKYQGTGQPSERSGGP